MAKRMKLTTTNVAENKVFANDDLRQLLFTFVFDADRWKKKKNLVLEELKRGFRYGFVFHHPGGMPFSCTHIDFPWQPVTINLTSYNDYPRHLHNTYLQYLNVNSVSPVLMPSPWQNIRPRSVSRPLMPSIWCRRSTARERF